MCSETERRQAAMEKKTERNCLPGSLMQLHFASKNCTGSFTLIPSTESINFLNYPRGFGTGGFSQQGFLWFTSLWKRSFKTEACAVHPFNLKSKIDVLVWTLFSKRGMRLFPSPVPCGCAPPVTFGSLLIRQIFRSWSNVWWRIIKVPSFQNKSTLSLFRKKRFWSWFSLH